MISIKQFREVFPKMYIQMSYNERKITYNLFIFIFDNSNFLYF